MDWTGSLHAGVSLEWDYKKRTVKLSTSGYTQKVLIKHAHPTPKKSQHTPRQPEPIIYGPFQPDEPPDNSKDLTKDEKLIFSIHFRFIVVLRKHDRFYYAHSCE